MVSAALGSILLRKAPEALAAGVASGDYQIYGGIIRSMSSGQIVGHLQETAAFAAKAAINPAAAVADATGHVVTIYQNEQIKSALSTLQTLQVANLALGAVSIGVSIAGTALLSRQITKLDQKIDRLSSQMEALAKNIDELHADAIARDFTKLRTIAEQLDQCWTLQNPGDDWRRIAQGSHSLANEFLHRCEKMLAANPDEPLAVQGFADAYALASSIRVTAWMAAGEDDAARGAAMDRARKLSDIGSTAQLGTIALHRARQAKVEEASPEWSEALETIVDELRLELSMLRQREIAAATMALTLDELKVQGISGRQWLEAARAETENPLLFLPSKKAS